MIFKIVCDVVADGLVEPEVAALLAPELRGLLISQENAHSWRSYFEVSAESSDEALATFKKIFADKIGTYTVVTSNETVMPR